MMKMNDGIGDKDVWTQDEVYEFQREQEQSLIRNVALDSIILILAIVLYESSDIKNFYNVYYTAAFFGVMAFSFHIGFRFAFRSLYEDSAIHRRENKRMKRKMRKEMSNLKLEMDQQRQQALFKHQMASMRVQHEMAGLDGTISPQEQAILDNTHQQMMSQYTPQQLDDMAKQMGIDRHRVGPIPVGPSLTISPAPLGNVAVIPIPSNKVDLDPSNQN